MLKSDTEQKYIEEVLKILFEMLKDNNCVLTYRELEVFCEMIKGKSNLQIAHKFFISTHTVKTHVSSILYKLHAKNRTDAVIKGILKILNI